MVDTDFGLCGACWRDTPFIGGVVCDSCGIPVHGGTDDNRIDCDDCLKTPPPWSRGRAALIYRDRARQMVLALKHGDRPEIARPAGIWMTRVAQPLLRDGMIVAPVPLHPSRLFSRKYNQSALLAKSFARETGLNQCPDLLIRTRRTSMLDGKTAEQRFADLSGAVKAHPKRRHLLVGRDVLLIDDVMTTGATLAACTAACRTGGANDVFILTLARVAKDD